MGFRIIVISGNMEQVLLYDGAAYIDVWLCICICDNL